MGLPPRPEQKDPTNTFLVSQIESDRAKHQIEVQRIQDERDRAERRVRHIEECVERVRQAVEDARRGGA
jgi:hypothetical protein